LNPEIKKSRIQELQNECHGRVAGATRSNERLTQRSQRSDKVAKVFEDAKKWDGLGNRWVRTTLKSPS
jgi:hypothetical protein